MDHTMAKHQGIKIECEFCDKTVKNRRALNYHMNSKHPEQKMKPNETKCKKELKPSKERKCLRKPFKCDSCPKEFANKGNLKHHNLAIHQGLKIKCN